MRLVTYAGPDRLEHARRCSGYGPHAGRGAFSTAPAPACTCLLKAFVNSSPHACSFVAVVSSMQVASGPWMAGQAFANPEGPEACRCPFTLADIIEAPRPP
eukprot:2573561-Prymnesium_polylepis.2